MILIRAIGLTLLLVMASLLPSSAAEADLRAVIAKFATAANFSATEAVVRELAATSDPAVEPPLSALADGNLYIRKADSQVFVGKDAGDGIDLLDPLSGEKAASAAKTDLTKIKVNNGLRRVIRDALGTLTLRATDPAVRIAAAATMFKTPDAANIEPLDAAIAAETDASVKALFEQARAASLLVSDRPEADKLSAIALIAARGDRDAVSLLTSVEANSQGAVKDAASSAIATINSTLALWDAGQNIWYGISLGSVLLLAAIGLAITFGVMGVINMAHGE
ncbi:urea ABC transporter permease subunit UrtB, partial [Mesorhizobium sp. M4B.F.Ca.ET.013.02.1.1]